MNNNKDRITYVVMYVIFLIFFMMVFYAVFNMIDPIDGKGGVLGIQYIKGYDLPFGTWATAEKNMFFRISSLDGRNWTYKLNGDYIEGINTP